MRRAVIFLLVAFAILAARPGAAQRVLFDASHGQTAGNADWIVDADSSQQPWKDFRCGPGGKHHSAQRFPTPPQETLSADSPETVWSGGISAWAVDLVRDALDPARDRDWQIEQYPWDATPFTFGDPDNVQDLSNYDVLVLCEPNVLFTDAEAQAIREFVANGGGLFLVADHETSDRNCSGGPGETQDSPFILNRLMQTAVDTSAVPPYFDPADPDNDYGAFGIWFYENGNDDSNDSANKAFDWFTEAVDDNVSDDPADPIVHGPFGDGSGGLGLFAATHIAVSTHPEKGNPTARGHVWRNGQGHEANAAGVLERVTLASAQFGQGRVVAIVDSSPADDGTGEGGLHDGWDKAEGGVANDVLFLNATEWVANPTPDLEPPKITSGPTAAALDCSARVSWVTDEPASSRVEWGPTEDLGQEAEGPGFTTGHGVELAGLGAESEVFFRVSSLDPAGNGPAESAVESFTTGPPIPLQITDGPFVQGVTHAGAVLSWSSDKPAGGEVRFRTEGGELQVAVEGGEPSTRHQVELAGLSPETTYLFRVAVTDACEETVETAEASFTTLEEPPVRDLSGWRLVNDNPDFALTLPPGTLVPAGGLLVIGRDNDRAAFETEWGPLGEGVVYLSSGNRILVNSTARPYTLLDAEGHIVDGPTVKIRAGRSLARASACGPAGDLASWEERDRDQATPGAAPPASCGAGVVIGEMADGRDFRNEFVEVFVDVGGVGGNGGGQ